MTRIDADTEDIHNNVVGAQGCVPVPRPGRKEMLMVVVQGAPQAVCQRIVESVVDVQGLRGVDRLLSVVCVGVVEPAFIWETRGRGVARTLFVVRAGVGSTSMLLERTRGGAFRRAGAWGSWRSAGRRRRGESSRLRRA